MRQVSRILWSIQARTCETVLPSSRNTVQDISSVDLARWNELFAQGETLEVGKPQEALQAFEDAKAIDDQHAQLHYRIARCLDRLRPGRRSSCSLRASQRTRHLSATDAESTGREYDGGCRFDVDAAWWMSLGCCTEKSDFGMAGYDWYVDHVHPSIRGHQLIAQALTEKLIALKLLPATPANWDKPARRSAYRAQMEQLGQRYLLEGRRRLEWLDAWARRDRLRDDTLPVDTRGMLEMGNGFVEFGDYAKAQMPYEVALQGDPTAPERMLNRALQLFRSGRNQSALTLLKMLESWFESRSTSSEVNVALAVVLLDSGQRETAARYLARVEGSLRDLDAESKVWLDELQDAERHFN